MSKFTKGPWGTLPEECGKDYIRVRGTALGGRFKIANVITPSHQGVHDRELQETRANAKLIAAAPEMYDALYRALGHFDSIGFTSGSYPAINIMKALNKASGQ